MVTSSCTPKRDKIHKVKRSSKKVCAANILAYYSLSLLKSYIQKRFILSHVQVTIQSTSADELPPGWIKEIKTSVSGSKMRKDPVINPLPEAGGISDCISACVCNMSYLVVFALHLLPSNISLEFTNCLERHLSS